MRSTFNSPQQHAHGMGSGVEEVSDGAGSIVAVMSNVVWCADGEVFRNVVEVAAVLGMVAVDVSEVANESLDIAKALDIIEPCIVAAWLLGWPGNVRLTGQAGSSMVLPCNWNGVCCSPC